MTDKIGFVSASTKSGYVMLSQMMKPLLKFTNWSTLKTKIPVRKMTIVIK